MSYLIQQDYWMQIQPQFRAQLTPAALSRAELVAIEELRGYVSQKYLTGAEFTSTNLYSAAQIYLAANRVYLNYAAYNPATNYTAGQFCSSNYSSYLCIAATTGTFDPTAWLLISNLYYAAYPAPPFNIYGYYNPGDKVFWNGNTYTALQGTKTLSLVEQQQYGDTDSVPLNNIFPDDPNSGAQYWTSNGAYTVPAGAIGSAAYSATSAYALGQCITYTNNNIYINTTAISAPGEAWNPAHWQLLWVCGDNRTQLMVTHAINIALYWAHYAIAPNVVPEKITAGYTAAKEWAKSVMDGDVTTPLPPVQPRRGQHILADSQVNRGNYYV